MLEIIGLSKRYPGTEEMALNGINLTVHPGEWVVVLGRSGAGKSTLIRCINRLVEPDAGEISWAGRRITGISDRGLRQVRSEIGMIFQHFNLLPRLSVMTNVIAGKLADIPLWRSILTAFSQNHRQTALQALRSVGLEHLAPRRVDELSGGQCQRVAIARVLMQNPRLLLGDEPVSNLDPITSEQVLQFISMLHRERQMTVVLNLHDVSTACRYATRIVGLAKGKIVFDGLPEQLGEAEMKLLYPPDEE